MFFNVFACFLDVFDKFYICMCSNGFWMWCLHVFCSFCLFSESILDVFLHVFWMFLTIFIGCY